VVFYQNPKKGVLHFTLVVTLQIPPNIKRTIYFNLFSENQPYYLLSLQYKKEKELAKKDIDIS
jgi:hypothetical protein